MFKAFQLLVEYNEEDIDKWNETIKFFEDLVRYYDNKYDYFMNDEITEEEYFAEQRAVIFSNIVIYSRDYLKTLLEGIHV